MRDLNIQPTITVRPGSPMRLVVSRSRAQALVGITVIADLKLPRLPDRTPVKLGIQVSPQFHVDL
jgi:type IV secretory pathway VirB10-like protein